MAALNPDDFVIARKRKKYRFALFANSPLCFEFDDWLNSRAQFQELQGSTLQNLQNVEKLSGKRDEKQPAADVIEVGAGTGLFSVELAGRHPELFFVAVDVKADRLQKGAYVAAARGITNIAFLRTRADQLGELFQTDSLSSIWLTFPDPFPKKGSSNRRLTSRTFLSTYAKLLKNGGNLYLKHDDREFFHWSLEQLVSTGWSIRELSFDLHESDLSNDYKILTTYETRWLGEGKTTNFVRVDNA